MMMIMMIIEFTNGQLHRIRAESMICEIIYGWNQIFFSLFRKAVTYPSKKIFVMERPAWKVIEVIKCRSLNLCVCTDLYRGIILQSFSSSFSEAPQTCSEEILCGGATHWDSYRWETRTYLHTQSIPVNRWGQWWWMIIIIQNTQ